MSDMLRIMFIGNNIQTPRTAYINKNFITSVQLGQDNKELAITMSGRDPVIFKREFDEKEYLEFCRILKIQDILT